MAPPVALVFLSLAVGASGVFLEWNTAMAAATVLSLVGEVGVVVICAALLRSSRRDDRARLWTGLASGLVLCGLRAAGLPQPTSFGGGLLVLACFVLLGFGALAQRTPHG